MKYIVLLGDGMADFPHPDLNGRTPLQAADTPHMDRIARDGICGLFCPIPGDLPAGSDIGNLSVFGYDPHRWYTGRAPLEAASQGIPMAQGDVAFRCNLVTLADGRMASFTSGHITSEEAAPLIDALNDALGHLGVRFHAGVGYRHLMMLPAGGPGADGAFDKTVCTPPHDISEQPYAPHLPSGPGSDLLREVMEASRPVLADHPVSHARQASGQAAPTSVWLWGQGSAPALPSYRERFGLKGAVVSAVDLVRGIGRCAGLDVLLVPGTTGYLDTNYEGKVAYLIDALESGADFGYLHVEAPDETGHEGRPDLKVQAVADFDARVVGPITAYADGRGDVRLVVGPDHVTSLATRTHAGGPVPFAMAGPGIAPDGVECYDEQSAEAGGLLVEAGHLLIPHWLGADRIAAADLGALRAETPAS